MTIDPTHLEHESGLRPLGEYPDHCWECRQRAGLIARRANCDHSDVNEISLWGVGVVLRSCAACGLPQDERP